MTVSKSQKKSKTVKSKTVKAVKAKQVTAPQANPADYDIHRTVDTAGIHITITHLGRPIYKFFLPACDYMTWRTWTPQQQMFFVSSQIPARLFGNNTELIGMVAQGITTFINQIIVTAQRGVALRTTLVKRA